LLNSPLTWINGGIFLACWLFGSIHAWGEHSTREAAGALLFPPYGLYMAVEYELGHRPDARQVFTTTFTREACLADAAMFGRSGLSREQYDVWCSCSTRMIADGSSRAEAEFIRQNGKNSTEFGRLVRHARQSCYATSRYLGTRLGPSAVIDE